MNWPLIATSHITQIFFINIFLHSEVFMSSDREVARDYANVHRRVNSVQKDAFLDRRLNTVAFLLSLEEND